MNFSELDTPALLINLNRMERNITRMAELARRNHVNLRPHTKSHKCPEIAKLQLEGGATGITCAKSGEAEVMAVAGIDDIFIANEVIGEQKYERLIKLAGRTKICIAVDSEFGAAGLNAALSQAEVKMDVMIEINCGQDRSGVLPGEETLRLAKAVAKFEYLNLRGLMTHGGHAYSKPTRVEIEEVGQHEGLVMARTAELLRHNGLSVETVSVGSTPTVPYCAAIEGITEIRPGTYIFNDLIIADLYSCTIEDCALFVLATVTSRPAPNRIIIDAGKKSLSMDKGVGGNSCGYGLIPAKNTFVSRLSEEHGVIESETEFTIGEKIKIIPNHACLVVNMFEEMHGFRENEIEVTFKVAGRGKMT